VCIGFVTYQALPTILETQRKAHWGGVIDSLIRCDKDIYRPSPT